MMKLAIGGTLALVMGVAVTAQAGLIQIKSDNFGFGSQIGGAWINAYSPPEGGVMDVYGGVIAFGGATYSYIGWQCQGYLNSRSQLSALDAGIDHIFSFWLAADTQLNAGHMTWFFPGLTSIDLTQADIDNNTNIVTATEGDGSQWKVFQFTMAVPTEMQIWYNGNNDSPISQSFNGAISNVRFDPVPEPASLGLMGLAGLAMMARRR